LNALDLTVASIGNVSDSTHLAAAGMVSAAKLRAARAAGAVGIICARFTDAKGQALQLAPVDRLIAADIATLRKVRKRLLVVCGVDREDATRAAIAGGLATHLCVDEALGVRLLAAG
jgi:deoxyribonucleoside regulator